MVAGGASLYGVTREDVVGGSVGQVVAVNRAFGWLVGRCDYWLMGERPDPVWTALGRERISDMLVVHQARVVAPHAWVEAWSHEYPQAEVIGYAQHETGGASPGWDTGETWLGGSTVQALAWCCSQGAREIHVVGADMCGRGGWGYRYYHVEDERWRDRWDRERASFTRAVVEARAHGVEITRYGPGVPVCRD